jgi:hypothetical protein
MVYDPVQNCVDEVLNSFSTESDPLQPFNATLSPRQSDGIVFGQWASALGGPLSDNKYRVRTLTHHADIAAPVIA